MLLFGLPHLSTMTCCIVHNYAALLFYRSFHHGGSGDSGFSCFEFLFLFIFKIFLAVLVFTFYFGSFIAEHFQLLNLFVVFSVVVLWKGPNVVEVLSTKRTDEYSNTHIVISECFFKSVAHVGWLRIRHFRSTITAVSRSDVKDMRCAEDFSDALRDLHTRQLGTPLVEVPVPGWYVLWSRDKTGKVHFYLAPLPLPADCSFTPLTPTIFFSSLRAVPSSWLLKACSEYILLSLLAGQRLVSRHLTSNLLMPCLRDQLTALCS